MKNAINLIMADENRETIDELIKKLPKEKFNVMAVTTDGAKLFDLIKEHRPDVVIMDLVLPQLDGFAVMEKLKNENIDTNIIVHTSLSLNGFVNKAMQMGAKYYAIKPFSPQVLMQRIEEIFDLGDMQPNTSSSNMCKMEEKITNIFITVGIPAHIKGYQFLREAIKLAIANPEIINSIT